jgi:hypothetical protein
MSIFQEPSEEEVDKRIKRINEDPKYTHPYDKNCRCDECNERYRRVLAYLIKLESS